MSYNTYDKSYVLFFIGSSGSTLMAANSCTQKQCEIRCRRDSLNFLNCAKEKVKTRIQLYVGIW